jgi:hypothetical protein
MRVVPGEGEGLGRLAEEWGVRWWSQGGEGRPIYRLATERVKHRRGDACAGVPEVLELA